MAALRSETPDRLQGEYTTQSGHIVRVDAPVIIPNADSMPVVRVTWGGPLEAAGDMLRVSGNDRNVLQMDHGFAPDAKRVLTESVETVNEQLACTQAAEVLLENICRAVPALEPQDFECLNMLSYRHGNGDGGFYMIFFVRLYHGIPFLSNPPYAVSLGNAEPDMPNELTYGCIADAEHWNAAVSAPQEIGIIAEDIPLLPFSQIEAILAERIAAGYIERLDEIRLGYRMYIDPENPGEAYILAPVWAFAGSMRASTDVPFTREEVVFMPYKNMSSFVIDAQTGRLSTFAFDADVDRRHAPQLLSGAEK